VLVIRSFGVNPRLLSISALLVAVTAGCASPTFRAASGQQVSCVGVSCAHSLYRCAAGFEVCSGPELGFAVLALDKHGFWDLAKAYDAGPDAIIMDGGSTSVYAVLADGTKRRVSTTQCAQRNICAIVFDLHAGGLITEELPNCIPARPEAVQDCVVVGPPKAIELPD